MKKNHYIYIGLGVAALLVLYYAVSCKNCSKKLRPARFSQVVAPDEAARLDFEQKEI